MPPFMFEKLHMCRLKKVTVLRIEVCLYIESVGHGVIINTSISLSEKSSFCLIISIPVLSRSSFCSS